jgi:hypothetical protein
MSREVVGWAVLPSLICLEQRVGKIHRLYYRFDPVILIAVKEICGL